MKVFLLSSLIVASVSAAGRLGSFRNLGMMMGKGKGKGKGRSNFPSTFPSFAPTIIDKDPVTGPSNFPSVSPTGMPSTEEEGELFNELFGFAASVHTQITGLESKNEIPAYLFLNLTENLGTFTGYEEGNENVKVTLVVNEIIDDSEVLTNQIIEEIAAEDDEDEDTLALILEGNFQGYTLRGFLTGNVGELDIIAIAATTPQMNGTYAVFVVGDPSGATNDKSSNSRLLEDEVQGWCPNGALSRAKEAFSCRHPNTLEVDSTCVTAANEAYSFAVNAARGEYSEKIQTAQEIFDAAMAALKARKIYKCAVALAKCAALAVIPVVGTGLALRCAALEIAKKIAIEVAKRLAIREAKEQAIENADRLLKLALIAACEGLLAGLRACLNCEKNENDDQSDATSEAYPDPHFKTWNAEYYDYHGSCDMIFMRNKLLEMHIRTASRGHWSAITHAALRIGGDILEVDPETFFINKETPITTIENLGEFPFEAASNSYTVTLSGGQFIKVIRQYNSVTIRVAAHGSDFKDTVGMSGTFTRFGLIGRDGKTDYSSNTTAFAQSWEVSHLDKGDPELFRNPGLLACGEPNAPPIPTEALRELAEETCAGIEGEENRLACISDVILSEGDTTLAENEVYTDPLDPIERCASTGLEGQTCGDLGGVCVWRCDETLNVCRQDLCSEVGDLLVLGGRRLDVIEGCSCAIPFPPSVAPSKSPSTSNVPSLSPTTFPSVSPSSSSPSLPPSTFPSASPSRGKGKGKGMMGGMSKKPKYSSGSATSFADPTYVSEPTIENCPTPEQLSIKIKLDGSPEDITWSLRALEDGSTLSQGGPYKDAGGEVSTLVCVPVEVCKEFSIYDSYGDGLYSGGLEGGYEISLGGTLVAIGQGNFGFYDTVLFGPDCPATSAGSN